jgi:GNAT superfamily N-acetyltransferase
MSDWKIRRATDADSERIFELYGALESAYHAEDGSGKNNQKLWREVAGDPRQYILLAELDGKVAATATVIVVPNLGHHGKPWAVINNVVTDAACRGLGIGKALIAECGKIAKEKDCYKIVLSSNLVRKEAHEFYRRLGWTQSHIGFSLEI